MPVMCHKEFTWLTYRNFIFMPVTYISNMHHMSSMRMLLQEIFQLILKCRTLHTVWSLIMSPESVQHNTEVQFRFFKFNSFVLDIIVKPLFYTSTGNTSNWIESWKKHKDWEMKIMQSYYVCHIPLSLTSRLLVFLKNLTSALAPPITS
jgi:hypothetical protein